MHLAEITDDSPQPVRPVRPALRRPMMTRLTPAQEREWAKEVAKRKAAEQAEEIDQLRNNLIEALDQRDSSYTVFCLEQWLNARGRR